jgi:nicotinamidase/pyrazinamidase
LQHGYGSSQRTSNEESAFKRGIIMTSSSFTPRAGDALIIVDVQHDFLPGGALAVGSGDAVIEPLNRYAAAFHRRALPVFATRDWHPPDHSSFLAQGGPWPPHCIAGTEGAQFAIALTLPEGAEIVSKGNYQRTNGYSAFDDTNLSQRLREQGCTRVFVGGLATDYCVRATAIDALREGFEVVVLQDAVRAVEKHPGDEARALGDIVSLGGKLATFTEVAA